MRVVGVIAEYNPFHSGHAYHLARAKALAQADYALAIMSGDFVQRGEPAMFPKKLRAKWALQSGADLVLSLPAPYSLTSAAGFAKGAVGLLHKCGLVDALCFGSESGDVGLLSAALTTEDGPVRAAALRAALEAGQSYPAACGSALRAALPALPAGPNDILGLEYMRALDALGSPMEPIALARQGAGHDEGGLAAAHASATALRNGIRAGDWESLAPFLCATARSDIQNIVQSGGLREFGSLSQAILYALRRLTKDELAALGEVREGLENPLYRACRETATVDELLALVKTRRYPMARLKRACLCALLGISGADLQAAAQGDYLRVLGVRREAFPLLSRLNQCAAVPVISKFADATRLAPAQRSLFELDLRAAEIACLAAQTPQAAPFDFGEPLLIVD
ncbi:MAG: nucleotidyltransferase family protein [Candidatus Pelethousia sp.]|nr:nucleotidyltransferase family protein [Candidatus Pelethousia sp.]